MAIGWADNLDMLAQSGVLDFDAPSYVLGQPPRYVGNPAAITPLLDNPPRVPGIEQPKVDEFKPSQTKNNLVKTPAWKKWVFGLLTAGALIFTGFKFKSKLIPIAKKIPTKVSDFFTKTWDKLKNVFKKKP